MVLVDSSVWIDFFNGVRVAETERLDALLSTELLLTGDIILAEVLQGFRSERHYRRAAALLRGLAFQEMLGKRVAIQTARNYRRLRSRGITVRKTLDLMIATFCILNGHRLLYSDRDFDPLVEHLGLRPA